MKRLLCLIVTIGIGLAPVVGLADTTQTEGVRANKPRDSHTFASFYGGDDLADGSVKSATISWLPESGVVHLLRVGRGRNFLLAQTLFSQPCMP
jgi:hypothetical protein